MKIHVERKFIRIYETRTRGKTEILKGTKNNASKRTMPLIGFISLLTKLQAEYKAFCGNSWIDSGYVVTDETGKPISFGRLHKTFKRILQKNGLPEIRIHDLRHSVATYLLEIEQTNASENENAPPTIDAESTEQALIQTKLP